MFAAVRLHPQYFGHFTLAACLSFALAMAGLLYFTNLRPILVAQLHSRRLAMADMMPAFVLFLGAAGAALCALLSVDRAVYLLAASHLAGSGLLARFIWKHYSLQAFRQGVNWMLLGRIIGYGIRLFAANTLQILSMTLTVLLLRYLVMGNFTVVGLYTRAVALCNLTMLMPLAVSPLLYAKWSEIPSELKREQVEITARVYVAYGVFTAMVLIVLGKAMLWLLYGSRFVPAYAALYYLAPAMGLMPVFSPFNNLLASEGRAGITAWIMAGAVAITAAATCTFVPHMGMCGAALAVLLARVFMAGSAVVVCAKLYRINVLRCLLVTPSDVRYIWTDIMRRPAPAPIAPDGTDAG